jgi:hypothetical protein
MSKFLLALLAAGGLFVAVPASAQDIGVSVGERGVRVGVGNDRDRDYRRHNDRRRVDTDGRGHRGGCVEVTTKKRLPNGNVIIKKTQRC